MAPERIFLVGLSGSGKSTVGRLVAERLGWGFLDTDRRIEERSGRDIPDIFSSDGEAAFRQLECEELQAALGRDAVVVATGGGAVTTEEGRQAIQDGFSVWLSVSPATASTRLAEQPGAENRPLLAGNREQRLSSLLDERLPFYQLVDAAVDVDAMSPDHVAAEVVRLWHEHRASSAQPHPGRDIYYQPQGRVAATVRTQTSVYPVVVENGALEALGEVCQEAGLTGRALVIADAAVSGAYGEQVLASLRAAGYEPEVLTLTAGEAEKNLQTVSRVYDWLIDQKAERGDFAVCLGGGVVTDLAGFAAATYLRGIAFVHVPTTLLGMVDAAIGGKTGVDHPRGKNLVGAFAQPSAVVIDPNVLQSLPARELRAGWAEVVKHGLILDRMLFDELAAVAGDASAMVDSRLIGWSTAIKATVVSRDERESEMRSLLNYGHTLGHAIESVTGYTSYLHGEAVAVGMRAAGLISVELGLLPQSEFDRQQEVIQRCGLPESAPGVDLQAVLDATLRDKKVKGGKLNWVLLEGIGHATTRDDVPAELVERVTRTVLSG